MVGMGLGPSSEWPSTGTPAGKKSLGQGPDGSPGDGHGFVLADSIASARLLIILIIRGQPNKAGGFTLILQVRQQVKCPA